MLPVVFMTLALDAMPFITHHLPVFNSLRLNWRWIIVEGVAANVHDTSWCAKIAPRLSVDGTTEFLNSIKCHPRVSVLQKPLWPGKVSMCNAAVSLIKEPCLLFQVDSDEIHERKTIEEFTTFFSHSRQYNCARFRCNFFVGMNIVTTGDDAWGNRRSEWLRAFRFMPGMQWEKHEPPVLQGINGHLEQRCMERDLTFHHHWTFQHYAYCTESQVLFKQAYYGYTDAVKNWKRLQENQQWPVERLSDFLPWVGPGAGADLLWR